MDTEDQDDDSPDQATEPEASESDGTDASAPPVEEAQPEVIHTPAQLGVAKYVHAAFIGGGILVAYICSNVFASGWGQLASWPAAARAVPQLLRFSETERSNIGLGVGAVCGVVAILWTYRNERIRTFSDEVASELSKVTWPNKEAVTNGTIVVIVASIVAAVYIALLDRLWSFITALIYEV